MKTSTELTSFLHKLGYSFKDMDLLAESLTHASLAGGATRHNQRMEFLGDRVLGLIVAGMLMDHFPDMSEGELAPRFNALVRRETLAEIAGQIDLGRHIKLGRSEMTSGGRRKAAILADAMEAVIAALYLDAGLPAAGQFITTHWNALINDVRANPIDAKTRVQEWLQGNGRPPPRYVEINRAGPDHAPVFTVEARLDNGTVTTGSAKSKKLAQQEAAEAMLALLEGPND